MATALACSALLLLAGCGSSTTTTATKDASAPAAGKSEMESCITNVGFTTKTISSREVDVLSGGGKLTAEIQTFKTKRAAKRFAKQLEVPFTLAGRRVAVWDAAASDVRRRVLTDCLRSPS